MSNSHSKLVVSTLEKFEVKKIESVGKPFDPKDQEALTMAASDTIPANHVVTEFEKGYYYKDRLLARRQSCSLFRKKRRRIKRISNAENRVNLLTNKGR